MNKYPSETVVFQGVSLTAPDGTQVTSGVKFALALENARPLVWMDPVSLDGEIGFMIQDLAVGQWFVYAQYSSGIETPVVPCSSFYITP